MDTVRRILRHERTPKFLSLLVVPSLLGFAGFNAMRRMGDGGVDIIRTRITEERRPTAVVEDNEVLPRVPIEIVGCKELHAVQLARFVRAAADSSNVPPGLLLTVMYYESGLNARARSPKGAIGLMQLMPSVAEQFHVKQPGEPEANISAGSRLLASLLQTYHGDVRLALAAYNAGPENVALAGGIPPFAETRQYIANIFPAATEQKPHWGTAENFFRIWNQ